MRRAALGATLACAAALAGSPRPAGAANPESTPVSPEASLTAGAVLASDDVGGGGWYNPASLAAVTRSSIQIGASAYAVSSLHVDGAVEATLPWGQVSSAIHSFRYMSVPSVLSYSFRLSEGVGVSLGVWTPYHHYGGGSTSATSSGPYPGAPGVTATYGEIYSFSETRDDTWAGAAVGWEARPGLRLGAMIQGAYATRVWSVDFNSAIETDSTDPLESGSHLSLSERGDQSFLGARALLGLQWDAAPAVRIAAAVRSPAIRVYGWGAATRIVSAAVLLPGAPTTQIQAADETPAGSDLSMVEPVRIYGGFRWARDLLTLSAEGDWQPALLREYASYRAAWNARLGGTWRLSPHVLVGAGLFRDASSAVPTEGIAGVTYYGATGGIQYRSAAVVKAQGGGDAWDLLASVAVRAAYGFGSFPGVYFNPVSGAGTAATTYGTDVLGTQAADARIFEGSISFFTAIAF